MNIALISFQNNTEVIGAKYLHAFMRSKGHESFLILQPDPDRASDKAIFDFIAESGVGIVGISLMSGEFFRAEKFARSFKERFPDIPVVAGGIHATIAPDECLSFADFAVRGEGEHALLELVEFIDAGKDPSGLAGICYKKEGKTVVNPPRELERNIDVFPFPKHLPEKMYVVHKKSLLPMDIKLFRAYSRYAGIFPNIITTRGCPYCCTYCCNSAYKNLYGHYPVRKRSVASVITECLEIVSTHRNCDSINIQDDCFFTYDTQWLAEFAMHYKKRIGLPFKVRTTPSHLKPEKLKILKDAGLVIIMIGMQSGSDRVNREVYRRNVTAEQFLKAARMVKDAGIVGLYDVISDNPYETEAEREETLALALQIPKPFHFQMFSLCFYQGTELNAKAKADGVPFPDPRLYDYGELKPTPLNKILNMIPTYPVRLMKFLAAHRGSRLAAVAIGLLTVLNDRIFQPLLFLSLMHRAYGYKPAKTLEIAVRLGKTAIDKRIARVRKMLAGGG